MPRGVYLRTPENTKHLGRPKRVYTEEELAARLEAQRRYSREYMRANYEKLRPYRLEYYRKNRERFRIKGAEWRRKWRLAHPSTRVVMTPEQRVARAKQHAHDYYFAHKQTHRRQARESARRKRERLKQLKQAV